MRQDLDLAMLGDRGGKGAIFVDPVNEFGPFLGSFSDGARAHGSQTSSQWISKALTTATDAEYHKLGLARTEPVARLSRVRMWNGEPLATEHALIPVWAIESVDLFDESIYAELERLGNRPVRARQVIRASLATSIEAAMLNIAEMSEVLRIERIGLIADGRAVELTRSIFRGDRFQFVDALRGTLVSVAGSSAARMR